MNAKRALPLLLLVLPGGSIALGAYLFIRSRRRSAAVSALTDTLRAGLPGIGKAYADDLAAAAVPTAPDELGPDRWGFFLAGIISRESQFGTLLRPKGPNGLGDFGHGHGLGQVDDRWNDAEPELSQLRAEHLAAGDWTDPTKHLLFVARFLRILYDRFAPQIEDLDERLRFTAAAYNAGAPRVQAQLDAQADPDAVTTGGDYGADVLRRAATYSTEAAA